VLGPASPGTKMKPPNGQSAPQSAPSCYPCPHEDVYFPLEEPETLGGWMGQKHRMNVRYSRHPTAVLVAPGQPLDWFSLGRVLPSPTVGLESYPLAPNFAGLYILSPKHGQEWEYD
jgi:hypothetical protein